jgi:uncharacterized repeat protein (TIGR03899 family)
MEIKDVLGLGKVLPIDKLLDMMSKAIGVVTKHHFDKKDVDTKAYEIKELAKAKAEAMKIMAAAIEENSSGVSGVDYTENGVSIVSFKQTQEQYFQNLPTVGLEDRTQQRINYQQNKQQLNIESVTAFAANELKDEQPVTEEPVDEGWSSRFFRYVEDISDEGLQEIWGRILAGEIKQPNSYSLRTLEVLKNLTTNEANVFSRIANLSITSGKNVFIYKDANESVRTKQGLDFESILILREASMLIENDMLSLNLTPKSEDTNDHFVSGNIIVFASINANSTEINIPVIGFSKTGSEILKLIKIQPSFEYISKFAQFLKSNNVQSKYAYILNHENGHFWHTQPLQEFHDEFDNA